MACNAYVEDVGEDWELLGGDEITIPAASEEDEGMILGRYVEEHTHDERINRAENKVGGSIQGDERTLCAESEVYTISPNLLQVSMILIHCYIDKITPFLYV